MRAARALTTSMLAMGAFAASAAAASAQAPAPAPDGAPAPAAPTPPPADVATATAASGGVGYGVRAVQPVTAAPQATLGVDGLAQAPAGAPPQVQEAIWAANEIIGKPYRYGGGHRLGFKDRGYDCSGTVSYALNGAGVLKRPAGLIELLALGRRRPGAVDHRLHEPGARLRRDRRPAAGHQRRRRPGGRQGPALAARAALDQGLQGAASRRSVARPRAPSAARLSPPPDPASRRPHARHGRTDVSRHQVEDLEAARPRRGPLRDARLQLPEAARVAAGRQEGHR